MRRLARPRSDLRSMEMNVSPVPVFLVPNAGFGKSRGSRNAVGPGPLVDSDVSHDPDIADDPDSRRRHGRLLPLASIGQVKVEAVESEAIDDLPACFRFEGREVRRTEFLVRRPIAVRDGIEKSLGERKQVCRRITHENRILARRSQVQGEFGESRRNCARSINQ